MKNRPLTSEEVKLLLGIDDFSELSDEQIRIFVSEIPKMDQNVAIRAIEQFPAYVQLVTELSSQLFSLSNSITNANASSIQKVLDAYGRSLDLMEALAQQNDISAADRRWFAEKAVEIADKMASIDIDNKNFLADVWKTSAKVIVGVAVTCIAFLGASFLNSHDD